jgi:uncharacterized protein YoaH (UPF0181 family)
MQQNLPLNAQRFLLSSNDAISTSAAALRDNACEENRVLHTTLQGR